VLLALFLATNRQVSHWRDSGTLFAWTAQVTERNALACGYLGTYLCQHGRATEGIHNLKLAVSYAPTVDMCCRLALGLIDSDKFDEAEKCARAILKAKPEAPTAWLALGGVAYERKDYPEAARRLRHYLTLNPGDADRWGTLGDALEKQGLRSEAAAAWRQALALNPTLPGLKEKLAQHKP